MLLRWVVGQHPLNSAEQNVSMRNRLKSFHIRIYIGGLLWLQVLLNQDKNIPFTFYVFPSQIMLRSNPDGKTQWKSISPLFPPSWHKQELTLMPVRKIALNRYNNLCRHVCVHVCVCVCVVCGVCGACVWFVCVWCVCVSCAGSSLSESPLPENVSSLVQPLGSGVGCSVCVNGWEVPDHAHHS